MSNHKLLLSYFLINESIPNLKSSGYNFINGLATQLFCVLGDVVGQTSTFPHRTREYVSLGSCRG